MQEDAPDTRRMLIAAADDLLSRGGPALVTLRAVGAAVEVSRTAPYRHFRNKDDLLSTVAAESLVRMKLVMQLAAADATTPSTADAHLGAPESTPLYRACLAYVRTAWEFPNHYRLEFAGDHTFTPNSALGTASADFNSYFEELVVEAQRTRTLLAGDVRDVGPLLWVILHGLAMSNHLAADGGCGSRTDDPAEQMPRLLALALQRLSPRAT
ncbi:TetR/AcrR family transcriptional regulator [Rhodococcus sp. D2-41]|uniref:TetR/AcrR family transcriptional regulator n=1 Tax=Speluncibacter jeojiensis TaxID=2710754 RepID=A0A9X4M0T7_9ACTN|nr:TetR/AcrR family transcriptional regulator [Rhodococcus sp. D2-41]MDG3008753.1 TetR/AcrR family transcriptional regulator [Rhodococcus sp. D2-41]MDG3013038.1 TetR/AcrR family transcriptional regulator [Corynebacteriales bacterium D3-21]